MQVRLHPAVSHALCPRSSQFIRSADPRLRRSRKYQFHSSILCSAASTGGSNVRQQHSEAAQLAANVLDGETKCAWLSLESAGVKEGNNSTVTVLLKYMVALARFEPFIAVRLVVAVLSMVTAKVVALAAPFQLKRAIDCLASVETTKAVAVGEARKLATQALLCHGIAKIFSTLTHELRNGIFARAGHRVGRRITSSSFAHLHSLEAAFHASSRTGALTRIVDRGTRSVLVIFRSIVFAFFPSAVEILLVSTILVRKFSVSVLFILLATFVMYVLWTLYMSNVLAALRGRMNAVDNDISARITDSLLNSDVVSVFDNAPLELSTFDQSLAEYESLTVKNEWLFIRQNVLQAWIFTAGLCSILIKCAVEVSYGLMTVGDLVMVSSLLYQMWYPLQFIGWQFRESRQALVDLSNLFAVMQRRPRVLDAPDAKPLVVSRGEIRFENVSFSYPSGNESLDFTKRYPSSTPTETDEKDSRGSWSAESRDPKPAEDQTGAEASVQNLTFRIPAGKTVALVGPTGSGKSSVLRLLTRMYDVTEGRISIDGQDISKVTLSSLRQAICVVPQDTMLWNDTIEYNIRYGRPDATFADVVEAAKAAAIHGAIMRMPQQYSTIVGERGVRMSGGERQRVAAARAFLRSKHGRILLQDEATSALDSKTEEEVTEALNSLGTDRTRVVVAHRLSTIFDADIIYVLRHGRIVEQGSHQQLLRIANGIYADMWRRQSSAAENDLYVQSTERSTE